MATANAVVPGMEWIEIVSRNVVAAMVDGERMTFHRADNYGGHPHSGLASFGMAVGDWRMIEAIAEDITAAFEIIDGEMEGE